MSMVKEILHDAEARMKSTLSVLEHDLATLRTGRASTALVEKLMIDYYETPTPLYQLASISVPEAQTIMIRPFDKTSLHLIERTIQASDLGLTPNNDGTNIRLNIPPLTQERRRDLTKVVSRRLEEARVAVRNIRRSAMEDLKEFEKESLISEDELHEGQESVQKLTDRYIEHIDEMGKRKEKEIMEV
jgi:ribosome recycling factor